MGKKLSANKLIRKIDDFPPLPTTVSKIIKITADPESSITDLKNVIAMEVSLTTSILKMANSPFFGLTQTVTSLHHAVSVLGMNEIRNLVLARAMFQTFKDVRDQTDFDFSFLWKHSFYCAIAAKMIAERLGREIHDFFVAGLIHDVGKLILFQELSIEALQSIRFNEPSDHSSFQGELQLVNIRHDELGMHLLQKWMFPINLTQSAGFHHRPSEVEGDKSFPLIICLANYLGHLQTAGDDLERNRLLEIILALPFLDLYADMGLKINRDWLEKNHAALQEIIAEEDKITALFS